MIEPWLQVSHGANAVQFYKTAFGATEAYRMDAPDGSVVARLKISTAGFWISGGTDSNDEPSAEGTIRMIITTPAPDELFAQAIKAGAAMVNPVTEEYGWRLGRLCDPYGHHWEIGIPLDQL
jgi:PhnB protein